MITKTFMAGVSGLGLALAATAAFGADLPSRRAPPVYAPPLAVPYNWTGVEFGLNTSLALPRGQSVTTTPFGGAIPQPSPISLNKGGLNDIGGGVGYNVQLHPGTGVVFGVFANVDASGFSQSTGMPAAAQAVTAARWRWFGVAT